ncbi:hypothetical protein SLA2020_372700 [Shorea laevis]
MVKIKLVRVSHFQGSALTQAYQTDLFWLIIISYTSASDSEDIHNIRNSINSTRKNGRSWCFVIMVSFQSKFS